MVADRAGVFHAPVPEVAAAAWLTADQYAS